MITDSAGEQSTKKLPTDFKGSDKRETLSVQQVQQSFPELKVFGATDGDATDDLRTFLNRVDKFRRNEQLSRAVKAIEDLAAAHQRKEDISSQLKAVQSEIDAIAERQRQRKLAESDQRVLDQMKRSTQEAQQVVDLEAADAEALELLQKMKNLYQEDPTRGSGAAQ
jgi:hypothetical protein